jgi:hypothetical protein
LQKDEQGDSYVAVRVHSARYMNALSNPYSWNPTECVVLQSASSKARRSSTYGNSIKMMRGRHCLERR